MKLTMFS